MSEITGIDSLKLERCLASGHEPAPRGGLTAKCAEKEAGAGGAGRTQHLSYGALLPLAPLHHGHKDCTRVQSLLTVLELSDRLNGRGTLLYPQGLEEL